MNKLVMAWVLVVVVSLLLCGAGDLTAWNQVGSMSLIDSQTTLNQTSSLLLLLAAVVLFGGCSVMIVVAGLMRQSMKMWLLVVGTSLSLFGVGDVLIYYLRFDGIYHNAASYICGNTGLLLICAAVLLFAGGSFLSLIATSMVRSTWPPVSRRSPAGRRQTEVRCEKCGNTFLQQLVSNDFLCGRCGHSFPTPEAIL